METLDQLNALSHILYKEEKFKNCTEEQIEYIIENFYQLISVK